MTEFQLLSFLQCDMESQLQHQGPSSVPVVGKYHLGAHVPEYYPKYSELCRWDWADYGEILETLWWPIDKVTGITQAATKAH